MAGLGFLSCVVTGLQGCQAMAGSKPSLSSNFHLNPARKNTAIPHESADFRAASCEYPHGRAWRLQTGWQQVPNSAPFLDSTLKTCPSVTSKKQRAQAGCSAAAQKPLPPMASLLVGKRGDAQAGRVPSGMPPGAEGSMGVLPSSAQSLPPFQFRPKWETWYYQPLKTKGPSVMFKNGLCLLGHLGDLCSAFLTPPK